MIRSRRARLLARRLDPGQLVAPDHEVQPRQREGGEHAEQRADERHRCGRVQDPVGRADRRGLVQAAPPLDAEVDDRDVDRGHDPDDRGTGRAALGVIGQAAQEQVADVQRQEQRGRRQPRVLPLPEDAPDRAAPHHPAPDGEGGEDDADLGAGQRDGVEAQVALPEPADAGQRGHAEREVGQPGRSDVRVHDPLRVALVEVRRNDEQRDRPSSTATAASGDEAEDAGLHPSSSRYP